MIVNITFIMGSNVRHGLPGFERMTARQVGGRPIPGAKSKSFFDWVPSILEGSTSMFICHFFSPGSHLPPLPRMGPLSQEVAHGGVILGPIDPEVGYGL